LNNTSVRPAQPSDAKAIAEIQIAAWQAAYAGLLPDRLLDHLSVEGSEQRWRQRLEDGSSRVLVYECTGRMAGFVDFGPSRDDDAEPGRVGEIYALYLDPADWRKGYGSALLNQAIQALRAQEFSDVTLWVLRNNQRGMQFYEAAGFRQDGTSKLERGAQGVTLREVRYRLSIREG